MTEVAKRRVRVVIHKPKCVFHSAARVHLSASEKFSILYVQQLKIRQRLGKPQQGSNGGISAARRRSSIRKRVRIRPEFHAPACFLSDGPAGHLSIFLQLS